MSGIRIDLDFSQIRTNLIWLLLAGDLWVSKSEGLLCFLFTGSEKANTKRLVVRYQASKKKKVSHVIETERKSLNNVPDTVWQKCMCKRFDSKIKNKKSSNTNRWCFISLHRLSLPQVIWPVIFLSRLFNFIPFIILIIILCILLFFLTMRIWKSKMHCSNFR